MQQSKYFYKNIPIAKYCRENNINIKTVRTSISKKKNDIKYKDYSEQQIVDMVIEASGTGTKYFYNGVPLKQYCDENNVKYSTILSRIKNIKESEPNLDNDQIVEMALKEYKNPNVHLFYKGIPLKKYCEDNDINYNAIRSFIYDYSQNNEGISNDELIEKYLKSDHNGKTKYYYCGIPLTDYCANNNLNYNNVLEYIKRHKKEDIDPTLSDDEYVEIIMEKYKPFELKYRYKGISLRQYCLKNSILYDSVKTFVRRKLQLNPKLNKEELIKEALTTIKRYGIIYYYEGIPLINYCKDNNLNYDSLVSVIRRKKSTSNKLLQEIIDETVIKYKENLKIKKLRKIFKRLKEEQFIDLYEIEEICEVLNISFENVSDLAKLNYKPNQAINLVWFFGDEINSNNKKIITYKRLREIDYLVYQIKNTDPINANNFSFYDLIGVMKCGLYNTSLFLINRQRGFIKSVVLSFSKQYNINLNKENFETFESEVIYYFLEAIDRTVLSNEKQVIKYVDLFVKGSFKSYLKKLIENKRCISLNQLQYNNDQNKDGVEKIDRLEAIISNNENNQTDFSKRMKSILNKLDADEIVFVNLRFKEQYSYMELANFFHLSEQEIIEKEKSILLYLKNNEEIKFLGKKYI